MQHIKSWAVAGMAVVAMIVCAGCHPGGMLSRKAVAVPERELVLVENGVALAPIIVFADAPPMTRQAADELAEYIEKTAGVRPEVIEGCPDPLPEKAIWVGYQPQLDKLFPKIDFNFRNPEEILIACDGKNLVIAGRDRWDPEHMAFKAMSKQPAGDGSLGMRYYGQREYGTVNAVYTFLQDHLGVRWLWPGEDGEDIIRKDQLAFAPFEFRYAPPFILRKYVMWWTATRPDTRGKLAADWSRWQRLTLDSSNLYDSPDGHAFGNWWERFHETNLEYLALQPDGTRGYHPQLSPKAVKMCKSNPAVWEEWLRGVGQQLEENPIQTLFRGGVNDGNLAGYCVCEKCKAWDAPEAEKRFLVWGGHSEDYVAMSDRQVHFANTLGRKLKERYPGKDYKVVMLAYGPSTPAPLRNKPDDNVIVLFVGNWFDDLEARDPRSSVEAPFSRYFADWAATGASLWWRPNLPGSAGLYHGMPDVPFGRVIESLRYVRRNNCTGLAPQSFWNFWPTQGPLYYMLAQLAWNPDQDGYAILDDYYRRGFGPAAGQVKAYWTLMEETRNRKVDEQLEFWQAYDTAFFEQAESLLTQAQAAVAGTPEAEQYARRLAHVRLGLDYTHLMIEAHELKARYKETEGQDEQVADRLREVLTTLKERIRGDTTYYMGPAHHMGKWLSEPAELWKKTK